LSAHRRASGVLCALLSAAAVCGGCGRQGAPHDLSATVAPDARTPQAAPPAGDAVPTADAAPTGGVPTADDVSSSAVAPSAAAPSCLPSHDGYLRLRMRGARNMDIDWHDADMQCDGGPRPGDHGLRVTFLGPARRGEKNLRFVFGIAAAPGARSAHNVPANVTVIFEREHKMFSTAGDGKCTIDEFSEQPPASREHSRLHRLSARGFCIAPATALTGRSALLLSRFDFAGAIIDEDRSDEPPAARP
jgi:hypothetical protein